MKKSQKLLSVLLSSLLIFAAISCANDSVEEPTKPEPKPETNKPQINLPKLKDGAHDFKLEPTILKVTYNEVINNKTTEGTMIVTPEVEGIKPVSKCVIDKCSNGNGTYYYYNFNFPKPKGNKAPTQNNEEVNVKGVVLNKTPLDKITIIVSNDGNNVELLNKDISFFGVITDLGGTSILSLEDSAQNQLVMIPKYDIKKYLGKWQKEINPESFYTIEIKPDGTGTFDFGTDKKGTLNVHDSKNGGIILVNAVDKSTIGTALILNKKLIVNPPKESTLLGGITEFTKKIPIIGNL